MTQLVTVFGATGAQGGSLARAALADPDRRFHVRAVTRRPESPAARQLARSGAEVFRADLDDAASVQHAMKDASAAFCVTNFWEHRSPEKEFAQARTMAQAAASAGVRHAIWSTLEDTRDFFPADGQRMPALGGRYNVPHFDGKGEANRCFIDSGVPTTLLYTSFYWDNLIYFGMAPSRRGDGTLAFLLPMADCRLPGIAAEDIGRCAFGILSRGAELAGKSIGIAGEQLTGAQMAGQLSLALGETVAYEALSPEQYRALGFPGAQDLGNMFQFKRDFEHAYCAARSVDCSRELNPRLQTFAAWLAVHRALLRRAVGLEARTA